MYLLWCIHNKVKPLNINSHTELRKLKGRGLMSSSGKITPLGLEALSSLNVSPASVPSAVKESDITDEFITKYVELFPRIKLPSGKPARADRRNLKANFIWFFKTYNYTWETVLKATAYYVDEYESKNFMYMRNSQYFISKMSPDKSRDSELANYCSLIVSGDYEDSSNPFSEKVV